MINNLDVSIKTEEGHKMLCVSVYNAEYRRYISPSDRRDKEEFYEVATRHIDYLCDELKRDLRKKLSTSETVTEFVNTLKEGKV